jgi:hypothetical protein
MNASDVEVFIGAVGLAVWLLALLGASGVTAILRRF